MWSIIIALLLSLCFILTFIILLLLYFNLYHYHHDCYCGCTFWGRFQACCGSHTHFNLCWFSLQHRLFSTEGIQALSLSLHFIFPSYYNTRGPVAIVALMCYPFWYWETRRNPRNGALELISCSSFILLCLSNQVSYATRMDLYILIAQISMGITGFATCVPSFISDPAIATKVS